MTDLAAPGARTEPAGRGLRRRVADEATAFLVIGALKLLLHMPERFVWALAAFGGGLSYRFSKARRDRARRNLRRVVEWMAANGVGAESYRAAASDPKALEAIVRAAFVNHVLYYVELARAPKFTPEWVSDHLFVETPDDVRAWLKPNRALIIVGLHLGAIEVPGIFAVQHVGKIVAPMETIANPRVQRYIFSTRDTVGVRIVTLAEAGELIASLHRNEAVGLVADRNLTRGGIEVELFGAPTKIPAGPALIGIETGAPMYVSAVRRVGRGRFSGRLVLLEASSEGGRRERSRAIAREEARLFEQFIIDAPEQWLSVFLPIWPDLEQPQHQPQEDGA